MFSAKSKFFPWVLVILTAWSLVGLSSCRYSEKQALRPDEEFYSSLETLMNRYGKNPDSWPEGKDKTAVLGYLKKVHGLEARNVVFARNMLGLGVGHSPDQAREKFSQGRKDAWGVPYDLILASSRTNVEIFDILAGVAINQGLGVYNPEISDRVHVVLKVDLHSQFCDIFKNFNGVSLRLIAREVNFLGGPGSASEDYIKHLRPALTAADSLQASVYTCKGDQVPLIVPDWVAGLADTFGVKLPEPAQPRKPMGPMKEMKIQRVELPNCAHNLEDYLAGMKAHGNTLLTPGTPI